MLSQPGVTSTTAVLGEVDHAVGSNQMMAEVIREQIGAVSGDTFVLESHGLLVEGNHIDIEIRVGNQTANGSLSDSTRRPGHHNREHCHTMPP